MTEFGARTETQRLLAAQRRIANRDARDIAAVLARVAADWLAAGSPRMRDAVDRLAAAGPFSRPMLEAGLPRMIEPLAGDALDDLVRRELGDWAALDGGARPRLVLHILPSNLPAHAAIPSALTLLLRAAALLKSGRDDRGFARLWIDSIGDVDADLAACLGAVYWRGDGEAAAVAMAAADLVVAAGGDRAIGELRRHCTTAGTPFIGHGHRVSLAVVNGDAVNAASAAALAADVALWDQLGCLSPQVCFVEGDAAAARRFAGEVCGELARLARSLPAGAMNVGEVLDVRRFRDAAAWRGFGAAGGAPTLFAVSERAGDGSVSVEEETELRPTPQHRCLRVVPVASVAAVAEQLEPHRAILEAAGVACETGFAAIAEQLRTAGVHHVARLGEMQRPSLSWRQGGRPRLAEWADLGGLSA